jgi:hypothetical protein
MLSEFWEKRKQIIEISGILVAVGALFVSMNIPNNLVAAYALVNIQIIWLVIITVSVAIIFVQLWQIVKHFQTNSNNEYKEIFFSTIKFLIGAFGFFLIGDGLIYVYAVYKPILGEFIKTAAGAFCAIALGIVFAAIYGFTKLFKIKLSIFWYAFTHYIALSVVLSILITFIQFGHFTIDSYVKIALLCFIGIGLIFFLVWYRAKKRMKKLKLDSQQSIN